MKPTCHVCGTASDYLLAKDGYDLYKCTKCALVFVCPQPTLEYLRTKIYSEASGFQAGRAQDLSKVPPSRCNVRYSKSHQDRHAAFGCRLWGRAIYILGEERRARAAGVELNKRLTNSARSQGIEMYDGTLDEAQIPPASFDAVVLGEVIEHVNDPRALVGDAPAATLAVKSSTETAFAIGSTTVVFSVDGKGHIGASGYIPTLSSCGTAPSVTGDDTAGTITVGASASSCTLAFATARATAPHCVVSNQAPSVSKVMSYTESATQLAISQQAFGGSKIDYVCVGN